MKSTKTSGPREQDLKGKGRERETFLFVLFRLWGSWGPQEPAEDCYAKGNGAAPDRPWPRTTPVEGT